MTRFVHASDLHLSRDDRGYSIAVLGELIDATLRSGADFLVLSGDIFDSFADAAALSPLAGKMIAPLAAKIPVYAIAGNHDVSGRNGAPFPLADIPGLALAVDSVSLIETNPAADILLIPHGADVRTLASRGCARSNPAKYLVAVAHGSLADTTWTGPDEAETPDAFDCFSFRKLGTGYAALGHIHARGTTTVDKSVFAYPGSAIAWRKGETGKRCALLVSFDGPGTVAKTEPFALKAAGQWLEKTIVIESDADALDIVTKACQDVSPVDSILVTLEGMISSETALERLKAGITDAFVPSRVRRMDWDDTDLVRYESLLAHPAAIAFVSAWKEKRADLEARFGAKAAVRALSRGLLSVKNAVEELS